MASNDLIGHRIDNDDLIGYHMDNNSLIGCMDSNDLIGNCMDNNSLIGYCAISTTSLFRKSIIFAIILIATKNIECMPLRTA